MTNNHSKSPYKVTCFHDGDCPVCRIETNLMKKLDKSGHVEWIDINKNRHALEQYGISYDECMSSMHVFDKQQKRMRTGVDGFLSLWQHLPFYNRLANMVSKHNVVRKWLEKLYKVFAHYRLKLKRN
ncbi:thiol-disulfide oxidoreductase DCC family protein [Methylophaga sp.]|uniref:thiol-disulfide oxidoreductase DCC family protein n=1 Tax=Methylophaga sp. TaxID=2024840 RepID=UPI003F69CB6A